MTISFGILEVANDHFPPNHIQPLTISGPTCHLRFSGKISTFGFQLYLVGSPAQLVRSHWTMKRSVSAVLPNVKELWARYHLFWKVLMHGTKNGESENMLTGARGCNWSNRSGWHTAAVGGRPVTQVQNKCKRTNVTSVKQGWHTAAVGGRPVSQVLIRTFARCTFPPEQSRNVSQQNVFFF